MKKVIRKIFGFTVTFLLVIANSFLAVQNSKSGIEFKLGENAYALIWCKVQRSVTCTYR